MIELRGRTKELFYKDFQNLGGPLGLRGFRDSLVSARKNLHIGFEGCYAISDGNFTRFDTLKVGSYTINFLSTDEMISFDLREEHFIYSGNFNMCQFVDIRLANERIVYHSLPDTYRFEDAVNSCNILSMKVVGRQSSLFIDNLTSWLANVSTFVELPRGGNFQVFAHYRPGMETCMLFEEQETGKVLYEI